MLFFIVASSAIAPRTKNVPWSIVPHDVILCPSRALLNFPNMRLTKTSEFNMMNITNIKKKSLYCISEKISTIIFAKSSGLLLQTVIGSESRVDILFAIISNGYILYRKKIFLINLLELINRNNLR